MSRTVHCESIRAVIRLEATRILPSSLRLSLTAVTPDKCACEFLDAETSFLDMIQSICTITFLCWHITVPRSQIRKEGKKSNEW